MAKSRELPPINDPLSLHSADAGAWGNPVVEDEGPDAHLPPSGFDYSGGMFAPTEEALAQAPPLHPKLIKTRTDLPDSYEAPHEATHRRYEPPQIVPVNQAASGFSLIAPTSLGLHYVKVIAAFLTLDAAGTLRFVQGSNDGTTVAALTGNLALGGANNGLVVLPPARIETPWLFTSSDQALGIFTATGKAQGWVVVCYSPYES